MGSSDVISVASKVCLRLVTDVEEVLDCGQMAEELGCVPSADWDLLQQVNLDDCTKTLECKLKEEELELLVNKKSTRPSVNKKTAATEEEEEKKKKKKKKKKKDEK